MLIYSQRQPLWGPPTWHTIMHLFLKPHPSQDVLHPRGSLGSRLSSVVNCGRTGQTVLRPSPVMQSGIYCRLTSLLWGRSENWVKWSGDQAGSIRRQSDRWVKTSDCKAKKKRFNRLFRFQTSQTGQTPSSNHLLHHLCWISSTPPPRHLNISLTGSHRALTLSVPLSLPWVLGPENDGG